MKFSAASSLSSSLAFIFCLICSPTVLAKNMLSDLIPPSLNPEFSPFTNTPNQRIDKIAQRGNGKSSRSLKKTAASHLPSEGFNTLQDEAKEQLESLDKPTKSAIIPSEISKPKAKSRGKSNRKRNF